MPIDPNIVLGIRPRKIELQDPLEQYGRAMQLKSLLGGQQLQGLQIEQAQRANESDKKLRELFAGIQPGQDVSTMLPQVYGIDPKTGMSMSKNILDQQETRAKINAENAKATATKLSTHRDALVGVNDQPAYDQWRASFMQDFPQYSQAVPPQFTPDAKRNLLLKGDELAKTMTPKFEKVDVGGEVKMVDTNPVTNPAIRTMSFKKIIGPADVLHARVQAATADPFNMMGINSIVDQAVGAGRSSGASGAVAPAAGTAAAPTVLGPSQGAPKGAPVIPVSQALQDAVQRGVNGDEFLKSIPPDLAAQVKSYAEGRQAFPTGFALKSPYFQTMLKLVGQYDPNFDAVNYNARAGTRKAFTSGTESKSLNALNTVMGHLDELDKTGSALNNTGIPLLNTAINAVKGSVDPGLKARLNQFNLTKQAVVEELERAYRGAGGGSQAEIEAWKRTLSDADSYPAIRAAIQQGVKLLKSKIDALGDQYSKGMGTTKDGLELLAPHAQTTFNRLIRDADQTVAGGKVTSKEQVNAPQSFNSLPDPAKFDGKFMTDTSTNTRYRSVGGKWVPQ